MGKPVRAAAPSKPSTTLTAVHSVAAEAERVSTADKRRAEELLSVIGRRKQQISEAFYEIGLALRELQKRKLHVALGFSSFAAMLQARDVMSAAQAFKLIKLVASVPREQALAMGQEKAFALVRYAEATPEVDTPQILLETGTLPGGKRLADASVRELDAALKGMSSARKKKGKASPEELTAHGEAASLQAALRKLGAKDAVVTAARTGGDWWLRAHVRVASSAVLRGAPASASVAPRKPSNEPKPTTPKAKSAGPKAKSTATTKSAGPKAKSAAPKAKKPTAPKAKSAGPKAKRAATKKSAAPKGTSAAAKAKKTSAPKAKRTPRKASRKG